MSADASKIRCLLSRLRERGEPVPLQDLARRLIASDVEVPLPLARRLVATALRCPPQDLASTLETDQLRPGGEREFAPTPLSRASFAVVDLETTGLAVGQAEILEIGAVRVRGMQAEEHFESLARPSTPIPQKISALTGIDDAAVADAAPLAQVMASFRSWMDEQPSALFVAHNASFDSRFVHQALARFGLAPLNVPVLCTMRLARRVFPGLGRYSLDHLCAHFGVSNASRHRALGDARAATRILLEILERVPHLGVSSVGALIDLQERRIRKREPGRVPLR